MTYIAQGYLTASKHESQWLQEQPKISANMVGWTDFVCGLGANLNGFKNSFSLPTCWEDKLAERLSNIIPICEKMKFFKTGSDACTCALRIARAYNPKRGGVGIGSGYHGNGNDFISAENPGAGCVASDYIKLSGLDEIIESLKCDSIPHIYCIIEPFELDYSDKTIEQLKTIRSLCYEKSVILIFDEIITGFRTPDYTVANYTGVQPDLICLGKALGNGYPISVLGGKKDIMEAEGYFFSGTFFGEVSALKASCATLDFLTKEKLKEFWHRGACFQRKLNILSPGLQLLGLPTRAVWSGRYKYLFWQEMSKEGYLLGKAWFLNFGHTPDILEGFIKTAKKVLTRITEGKVKLIGSEPKEIFKRNN